MREVTKRMIKNFHLDVLMYDFMGYEFVNIQELSFHHLIIPRRKCQAVELSGYIDWNGAILTRDTAHDYLHIIEEYDIDKFYQITSEMIEQNVKGYLDMKNILSIDKILHEFESEYFGERNQNGQYIIKEEYTRRLIKK